MKCARCGEAIQGIYGSVYRGEVAKHYHHDDYKEPTCFTQSGWENFPETTETQP